jgi:hypothetical protein
VGGFLRRSVMQRAHQIRTAVPKHDRWISVACLRMERAAPAAALLRAQRTNPRELKKPPDRPVRPHIKPGGRWWQAKSKSEFRERASLRQTRWHAEGPQDA